MQASAATNEFHETAAALFWLLASWGLIYIQAHLVHLDASWRMILGALAWFATRQFTMWDQMRDRRAERRRVRREAAN
jgi:hypothetical protein